MDFNVNINVGDLGKPITKLIEVVTQGIGTEFRPRAIRREAEAQAVRDITLAHAAA
jgi:hypothetical protein